MMLVPALLTIGTLGALYAMRDRWELVHGVAASDVVRQLATAGNEAVGQPLPLSVVNRDTKERGDIVVRVMTQDTGNYIGKVIDIRDVIAAPSAAQQALVQRYARKDWYPAVGRTIYFNAYDVVALP